MNAPTAMLLAAAGASNYDPNTWVQIRLSQMTTTLPAQDPDGVFVSLTETAAGWVPVLNYNGAGGVNDGFSFMVAWVTADIAAVIPGRAGEDWGNTTLPEFVTVLNAIPSDSAAWRPVAAVGSYSNSDLLTSLGVSSQCNSATQSSAGANQGTGSAFTAATTAVTAAKGLVWWQIPLTGVVVTSLRLTTGAPVVTPGTTRNVTSALTVASSAFVVGFGNIVNNPAAGNRSVSARFYTRVLTPTFADISAPSNATGWTGVSPASFGTPGTPASDPNALLSSFDTSAYPEWRPTIDDTGKTGPFDGYNEGVRWDETSNHVNPNHPFFVSFEVDLTSSAYAATQQFGFAAGISDVGTGPTMPGYKYQTAATTCRSNAVQFNTNVAGGTTSNALGSTGLYWPSSDDTTTAGVVGVAVGIDAAGLPDGVCAIGSRANALTAPVFSVAFGKDVNTLGTSSVAFRFLLWTATFPDYTNAWPA